MRVTTERKEEIRRQLLQAANVLFREQGYPATTTRHIAKKAKLATGTMFNYFPSKEELALSLVTELLQAAHAEFAATRRMAGTLDEWLFSLVATEIRHLSPTKGYLRDVLDGVVPRLAAEPTSGMKLRNLHLAQVRDVLANFSIDPDGGIVGWDHLYWSLYLGVLAHWTADTSPSTEATMSILDRAVGMFLSLVRFWPASPRYQSRDDD